MRSRTWGRFGAVVLAAALWTGQSFAPPAALAAGNLTVNCTPGDYGSIMDAVGDAVDGNMITVCAGDYSENVNISDFTSLKLIGKDGPRLTPPNGNYIGSIVEVHDSKSVTMSGFIVDGNGEFSIGAFSMTGIWWENSGGLITGNVVRNITRYGNSAHGYGIEITNSTDTVRNLTVTKNALVHSQQVGIYASGNTVVKISKNRVSMTQFLGDESSAIMLDGAADGASVDGNTLLGDWRPGIPYVAYGITIDSTSKAKVSKNSITELPMGIYLKDSDCASPLDTVENTISGNVLVDNNNGIYLESVGGALCESHVDGTKITSNKIYSHYDQDDANMGILLFTSGAPPVSDTTISGNQVMGSFNEHIMDVGSIGTVGLNPQKNKIGPMPPPGM